MKRTLPSLAWGSAQAGMALTLGSTGWLVSGLSPSPLVNSLLPVLVALPAQLSLPAQAATGYGLQVTSALVLLGVSLKLTGASVIWPMLAMLLFGIGGRMSRLPLQQQLLEGQSASLQTLRLGDSLGQLLGNLLTGLLFPLGKAVLQYANGLLLLLPLLPLALAKGQGQDARSSSPREESSLRPAARIPLERRSTLQGLLFGSLFSLMALWVRQVGAGSCLDFGLVLTAYGLGRTLGNTGFGPRLPQASPYLLMGALLACTQAPGLPGWGAVLLFLPMGVLAARSDGQLVAGLQSLGDEALRWQILERSGAIGGLAGALAIGAVAQVVGLTWALPIQVGAFALAALLLPRRNGRPVDA